MKAFGIDVSSLEEIRKIFEKHLADVPGVRVWLFGSRAKGNHKKNSDIDFLVTSRSKKLKDKIPGLRLDLQDSNVPYLVDLVYGPELAKAFAKEVTKTRVPFWDAKQIERRSPWRICPLGEHWVRRHERQKSSEKVEDVDGHCRKNPSGKDLLKKEEMEQISKSPLFQKAQKPTPGNMDYKYHFKPEFDVLIAGWTAYWNHFLGSDFQIKPDWIKILIATESSFDSKSVNVDKKNTSGVAIGLGQITESTWKILKNRKGEIKDHYIDVEKDDLYDPNVSIAAMTRWIFRKYQTVKSKLKRDPTLKELLLEYKGVLRQNPNHRKVAPIIAKLYRDSEKLNVNPDE